MPDIISNDPKITGKRINGKFKCHENLLQVNTNKSNGKTIITVKGKMIMEKKPDIFLVISIF